jgi:CBS domain-containing protein
MSPEQEDREPRQEQPVRPEAPQRHAPDSAELSFPKIGDLPSARVPPIGVQAGQTATEAITIMLANDFSQLPVMSGHTVKGMITWETIGSRLALGQLVLGPEGARAQECMVPHHEIRAETSLLDAIDEVVANQYVLIRDSSNKISGIVTTSDLSVRFHRLAEPFLLLREIENHIRGIIDRGDFTQEELQESSERPGLGKKVESVNDLNFGDYERLVQNKDRWSRLKIERPQNIH